MIASILHGFKTLESSDYGAARQNNLASLAEPPTYNFVATLSSDFVYPRVAFYRFLADYRCY